MAPVLTQEWIVTVIDNVCKLFYGGIMSLFKWVKVEKDAPISFFIYMPAIGRPPNSGD